MEIYISIDGVLRNTIQKFNHHYTDIYLMSDLEDDSFEYGITEPITNNDLLECYKFQSKEEFNYFFYYEFGLEIFGYAGLSYSTSISDLNTLINSNKEHNFTIVGLDELGKTKPATFFFLSKNGFMGDNVKFIKTDDIENAWTKCDYWITDNKKIIDQCPEGKTVVKFNTPYNQYFTNKKEITKLNEIEETWLKSLEKPTTLTLTESPKSVK
jgi:hypothetical protein